VDDGRSDRPIDENFQGYGQTMTDGAGGYRFRTKQFRTGSHFVGKR
jgi:protocatechuate 3,4-dioxygenase beta subunit